MSDMSATDPRWDLKSDADLTIALAAAQALCGDEGANKRARFAAWLRMRAIAKEKCRRLWLKMNGDALIRYAEMERRGLEKTE